MVLDILDESIAAGGSMPMSTHPIGTFKLHEWNKT
jgi:hypothetical protein